MDEITARAFSLLRAIKSVTFATVDEGRPDARIADVMLVGDEGIWFVTGRGKRFFRQLKDVPRVAVSGMDEDFVAVRILGEVRHCDDPAVVDRVFAENPMLDDLYPGDKRYILDPFLIHRGRGEIFDLSVEPPLRTRFAFGGDVVDPPGYVITACCTACDACRPACPVDVIAAGNPYIVDGSHCLECGRCAEVCPVDAINPEPGL